MHKISFHRPYFLLLIGFLLFPTLFHAQEGRPFFSNFSTQDMGSEGYLPGTINTGVCRDGRGILYVSNVSAILEYDGRDWRPVPGTEKKAFYKMARDKAGRVYTGGVGEIGYLTQDSLGQTVFESLEPLFPEDMEPISKIGMVVCKGNTAFFSDINQIITFDGKTVSAWKSENKIYKVFRVGEEVFAQEKHKGILKWNNGSWSLIPGTEPLKKFLVKGILPKSGNGGFDYWMITSQDGIFAFNNGEVAPAELEVNRWLEGKRVINTISLPNRHTAIGTRESGVGVMDAQGRLRWVIDTENGLENGRVYFPYHDREGLLWLALNLGLSRIERGHPLRTWGEFEGLPGVVYCVRRHKGKLWAGTSTGLYKMESVPGYGQMTRFTQIEGATYDFYDLEVVNGTLLASCSEGIFSVQNDRLKQLYPRLTYSLHASQKGSGVVWGGTSDQVMVLRESPNGIEVFGEMDSIDFRVEHFYEAEDGWLWLAGAKLARVRQKENPGPSFEVEIMDSARGFTPAMESNAGGTCILEIDGKPHFGTSEGLLRFDEGQGKLVPSTVLGSAYSAPGRPVEGMFRSPQGRTWFISENQVRPAPGNAQLGDTLYNPLLQNLNLFTVYPDSGGVLWMGTDEGLIRLDTRTPTSDFQAMTYFSRITLGQDSLLAANAFPQGDLPSPTFPADFSNLRLEFASTSYLKPEKTMYSWFLEGYDEDWSPWSLDFRKDYNQLPGGNYTFRVKSRNVLGMEGNEVNYSFKVEKPWYLTVVAFVIYGLLLIGLVYLIVRLNSARLRKANIRLEGIVAERTEQIRLEKLETEKQRDRAEESERVKKRFFANMTHELRTPLTLILGPVDQVHAESVNTSHRDKLNMVSRNSRKLLRLINQLLDIGKIESERMALAPVRTDLAAFVEDRVAGFHSYASEKGIALVVEVAPKPYEVDFDPEKLEKVLYNLLSNALKYTPQGGRISVNLGRAEEKVGRSAGKGGGSAGKIAVLTVKDSGVGIPEKQLPHIFDRYYMVEQGKQSLVQGTGIGLSLVKELVELHDGTIVAKSVEGVGTEFRIELPEVRAGAGSPASPGQAGADMGADAEMEIAELTSSPESVAVSLSQDELTDEDAEPLVLVIEDNADIRAYIGSVIGEKFRVMEAANGRLGVEKALEVVPDLVVTDIMMPELDGYGVIEALRKDEKTSHIPIIILSSKSESQARLTGFETGAEAYLTKPFLPEELNLRIGKMIELRQQLREKFRNEVLLKPPTRVEATSMEEQFLLNVRSAIEKNLDNDKFGVEDLAAEIGLSRVQLHRKFKALTGQTTNKFIRSYRLNTAMELIRKKAGTIAEISYQVGFSSPSYFTKCFVEEFGKPPSAV